MLVKRISDQFLVKDYNCAESILIAANEAYGLGIPESSYKLVSGFGAGLGCEGTCGALCGSLAVLGACRVEGRAHATPGFGELCGGFVRRFEETLGSTNCRELKKRYRDDEARCLKVVERAAQLLETWLDEHAK